MASSKLQFLISTVFAAALLFQSGMATTFTLLNKCDYTVWPGILSNAGVAQLTSTGFALQTGQSQAVDLPAAWAGRLWARTLCATDASTGNFLCQTADCGSGKIECSGGGAATPATLAEFTLDGSGGQDFYDVSLVDGYNLPILVAPVGGSGVNCSSTGCITDLNTACPADLKVMSDDGAETAACKSACDAFNQPEYCCTGAYGTPDTCKASSYSQVFKSACPRAYSYAYDDRTSTFICGNSPDYTITFCPSLASSEKASATTEGGGTTTATPTAASLANSSMVYEGALDVSSGQSLRTWAHVMRSSGVFLTLTALLVCHRLF